MNEDMLAHLRHVMRGDVSADTPRVGVTREIRYAPKPAELRALRPLRPICDHRGDENAEGAGLDAGARSEFSPLRGGRYPTVGNIVEAESNILPTTVKRAGTTTVPNSLPKGKLKLKKRPGILVCVRCGCEAANSVRDEGGWELWSLGTRPSDLCPECVPKALAIVGESLRIVDPQYMDEG